MWFPDGCINVVTGYGEEAREPLTRHEDIRKLAFTGSTAVGKRVMKNAADNVTDIVLELGGKSPLVVFPDVDPDRAVRNASSAVFLITGEYCEAGMRLFVHDDIASEFIDRLVDAVESMTMGDPLAEGTDLGPKIPRP